MDVSPIHCRAEGWLEEANWVSYCYLLSMSFLGRHPVCHMPCHKIDKNWRLHYQNDMPKLVCLRGKRWDGNSCQLFEEECFHFAMTHFWIYLMARSDGNLMPWRRHRFTAIIAYDNFLGTERHLIKMKKNGNQKLHIFWSRFQWDNG